MPGTSRLVIVANRLPVTRVADGGQSSWRRSPGGLVAALEPILQRRGGAWIGWTGSSAPAPEPFVKDGIRIRPIGMSESEVQGYYSGLCNRTIWPLFHDAIRSPQIEHRWWEPFVSVNARFAEATAKEARKQDVVWVHDFHLPLAPAMVRSLRPGARIGFFLHIPFPAPELFRWLPWREALLRGMLGADLVGMQTIDDAENFVRVCLRLGLAERSEEGLLFEGREVLVGAYPISIDTGAFEGHGQSERTLKSAARLRERMSSRRTILLGVDRLDYTKGIEARLRAFEMLLRSRAMSAKECVLVQIAVPSREHLPDYAQTRTQVEQAVGRINGEFAEPGLIPVHYFRRSFLPEDLAAYYRAADVMLVTPLRDGMNLVAKEYVAVRTDEGGALVLSEFAGASRELTQAHLINPHDVESMAGVMLAATREGAAEARSRMSAMRDVVRRHDVYRWADEFLRMLQS
ncbi:MAG: trehalose-6-phosphate synthase [Phycisphaeraceae bacterium]|nr:trehalose-6-phosphate synthase [Phycisphaeraceae bacterium]